MGGDSDQEGAGRTAASACRIGRDHRHVRRRTAMQWKTRSSQRPGCGWPDRAQTGAPPTPPLPQGPHQQRRRVAHAPTSALRQCAVCEVRKVTRLPIVPGTYGALVRQCIRKSWREGFRGSRQFHRVMAVHVGMARRLRSRGHRHVESDPVFVLAKISSSL